MSLLVAIVLGLVVGLIAGFITNSRFGIIGDILVGIVGAIVGDLLGGWLFGLDVTGFNLESILVATAGAVLVIVLYRALTGQGARIRA
jgi:uncharacterized membrane protein YeaQ/YmgE (transglycosylase-associated protein family)